MEEEVNKNKKRRRIIRKDPFEGLTRTQIARKFPFKRPIIDHLISDREKIKLLIQLLTVMKLIIRTTHDDRWFDIVKAEVKS